MASALVVLGRPGTPQEKELTMATEYDQHFTKFATIMRATGEVSAIANKSDGEPPWLDKLQEPTFQVIAVPPAVQVGMIHRDGVFYRKEIDPRSGAHIECEVVRIAKPQTVPEAA